MAALHGATVPAVKEAVVEIGPTISTVGELMDAAGVAVMVVGAVISIPLAVTGRGVRASRESLEPGGAYSVYRAYRQLLGRSILLGLEILVAADIIRTVAVAPTFTSVGVLAIIVVIRTFLSWSLELEISGRWPWQQRADDDERPATL